MRALPALLLVLPALLAGCVTTHYTGGVPCVPLRLVDVPAQVMPGEEVRIEVRLWNCERREMTLDAGPCGPLSSLAPWVVAGNESFRTGRSVFAAAPGAWDCPEGVPPDQAQDVPPGEMRSARVLWNGLVLRERGGEPEPLPPGNHTLRVEAGGETAEAWFEVLPLEA